MAEDRMLSDEILLGLIKKNGGGGGGTSDYNQLENQPQINGNTLTGDKTASDLGLASEDDVAGKQDALIAGNYISIADDGTISVTQGIGMYDVYSYVVAGRYGSNYYYVDIQKYKNGVLQSNTRYVNDQTYDKKIIDNRFSLQYNVGSDFSWHFVLLTDSNEHKEGESIVWRYNVTKDFTETFNVSKDSSTDLATRGDVNTAIAGKQDTLTFDSAPTDGSTNPVQSNGVYDALATKANASDVTIALATKQDASDNNLQTTDKTVVGGINELKSGLINVQADVRLNTNDLTTGSRTKNLLPITVSGIKEKNTTGTWDGDTYTENGISFAIQKDSDGKVTGITANGTASDETYFVFAGNAKLKALAGNNLILNGSIGGTTETYLIQAVAYNGANSVASRDGDSVAFTPTSAFSQVRILIANGVTVDHVNFYPMIRLATETNATFAPYIPSVESRIEAVESGITSFTKLFESATTGDYRNKFNSMYSTISALNFHDRVKSFINFTGTICNYCDMSSSSYMYIGSCYQSGKLTKMIITIDSQYSGTVKMEIDETAVTKTDLHTTEDSNKFTLYM